MSFVNITFDAYLASVIVVPYVKSRYVGPCYNGLQLYVSSSTCHVPPKMSGNSAAVFYLSTRKCCIIPLVAIGLIVYAVVYHKEIIQSAQQRTNVMKNLPVGLFSWNNRTQMSQATDQKPLNGNLDEGSLTVGKNAWWEYPRYWRTSASIRPLAPLLAGVDLTSQPYHPGPFVCSVLSMLNIKHTYLLFCFEMSESKELHV